MRCGTLFPSVLRQDPPFERGISAIERVTQDFPPFYLLAALADQMLPPEQSFALSDRLQQIGVETVFDPIQGASHGFVDFPSRAWPRDNDYWEGHIERACEWVRRKTIHEL